LLPRFPQQQPLDAIEGELAALAGVERLPCIIVDGHVEQGQQRRQCCPQGFVQGEELPVTLARISRMSSRWWILK
jgi:hypothetical protein